jgi:hypothetical protein
MKRIKEYFGTRWLAITWTMVILILISIPGSMLPKEKNFAVPGFDKFVHATLFGIFVWLWCLYYQKNQVQGRRLTTQFFFVFLVAALYGISTEFIQKYLIPMRDFDKADIMADWTGAILAYGYCNIRLGRARLKNS